VAGPRGSRGDPCWHGWLGELLLIFPLALAARRIALEASGTLGATPGMFGRGQPSRQAWLVSTGGWVRGYVVRGEVLPFPSALRRRPVASSLPGGG
jgi:hypothetical protein